MAGGQKTTNGKSEDLPTGWQGWLTMPEALKVLGDQVHHSFVRKMVSEGAVRVCEDPQGLKRYSPEDVNSIKHYVETLPATELRGESVKPTGGISHEEFRGATDFVKQVHAHLERMIPLLVGSWEKVMIVAQQQSERDAKRIAELESKRDELSAARERALSEEHDRAMVSTAFQASEKRKSKAFDVLMEKAVPSIVSKLGLTGDPMIGSAVSLLKSFKRDQLLMLLHPAIDMVTEEQKQLIRRLLGELSPEEKEGLGETPEPKKEEK
jgi:hypothetical protein